jgi:predicted Fe-Mo cluster-binding NifX family protein
VSVGKRYNSPSLIADGRQFGADMLSASIVFFALMGQYFGVSLDRIAAGVVAFFIVWAGWQLLSSSMRVLLDASVDAATLDKIRLTMESEPALSAVKKLMGRNSGRYIFVEADVELRITDLQKAHLASKRMEQRIRDEIPSVDRVLIHYEPAKKSHIRYAVPLLNRMGEISKHFGEAPYFALVDLDVDKPDMVRQEIITNPHAELKKGKGIQVARFLLEQKPDVIVARESLVGKGPGYAFADAGVETIETESMTLDDLITEMSTKSVGNAD